MRHCDSTDKCFFVKEEAIEQGVCRECPFEVDDFDDDDDNERTSPYDPYDEEEYEYDEEA